MDGFENFPILRYSGGGGELLAADIYFRHRHTTLSPGENNYTPFHPNADGPDSAERKCCFVGRIQRKFINQNEEWPYHFYYLETIKAQIVLETHTAQGDWKISVESTLVRSNDTIKPASGRSLYDYYRGTDTTVASLVVGGTFLGCLAGPPSSLLLCTRWLVGRSGQGRRRLDSEKTSERCSPVRRFMPATTPSG